MRRLALAGGAAAFLTWRAARRGELLDPRGRVRFMGFTGGPPLGDLAERRYIAGDEPNRLSALVRWLRNPQSIEPGTIMPDLGLSESEARDIAAYLYSE